MTQRFAPSRAMSLHDLHPEPDDMFAEVVAGLSATQKTLPCKYFYDAMGSQLFDQICELDEYYPTRTEIRILEEQAAAISEAVGERALVIELGSGSSTKTHILLRSLVSPVGYAPLDISREHLSLAAERIASRFSGLPVWPICADFSADLGPLEFDVEESGRLVFFPGSTIGNFDRRGQLELLQRIAGLCGSQSGQLLLGIDLVKNIEQLENAYNDAKGVTAAFNLNLLRRINRELEADFDLGGFTHCAHFDSDESRIEMHLVSTDEQNVKINGHSFIFASGESICTEYSYKFTVEGLCEVAAEAGWRLERSWSDAEEQFAILLLRSSV